MSGWDIKAEKCCVSVRLLNLDPVFSGKISTLYLKQQKRILFTVYIKGQAEGGIRLYLFIF